MVKAYLAISLGVLVAVLWPILRGFITKEFKPLAAPGLPPWLKKYGALLIFSMATGLIALAIWDSANPDAEAPRFLVAFLIGFGWEAAIEKFINKPQV